MLSSGECLDGESPLNPVWFMPGAANVGGSLEFSRQCGTDAATSIWNSLDLFCFAFFTYFLSLFLLWSCLASHRQQQSSPALFSLISAFLVRSIESPSNGNENDSPCPATLEEKINK